MQKKISDIARKGIIDKLILIGQIPGNSTYRAFFQRVYPMVAEIQYNKTSLLNEITRHCDAFPGDWGDDAGMFEVVDILNWTDQDFLYFCEQYVNPVFDRSVWDEEQGERINLQPECVEAINLYLRDCGVKTGKSYR